MPKKTMTFEDAMLRLREVTETLEKGDVTLEDSVKPYRAGADLTPLSHEKLNTADQKITELSAAKTEE